MIHLGQDASDALRRLDVFMSEPADDCEQALEWIPLLTKNDWELIARLWNERPPEWRANCAHIVGQFASESSMAVLRLALADSHEMVAGEAAIAICVQLLNHPQFVAVDGWLLQRLKEVKLKDQTNIMSEVDDILRLHGDA